MTTPPRGRDQDAVSPWKLTLQGTLRRLAEGFLVRIELHLTHSVPVLAVVSEESASIFICLTGVRGPEQFSRERQRVAVASIWVCSYALFTKRMYGALFSICPPPQLIFSIASRHVFILGGGEEDGGGEGGRWGRGRGERGLLSSS